MRYYCIPMRYCYIYMRYVSDLYSSSNATRWYYSQLTEKEIKAPRLNLVKVSHTANKR